MISKRKAKPCSLKEQGFFNYGWYLRRRVTILP